MFSIRLTEPDDAEIHQYTAARGQTQLIGGLFLLLMTTVAILGYMFIFSRVGAGIAPMTVIMFAVIFTAPLVFVWVYATNVIRMVHIPRAHLALTDEALYVEWPLFWTRIPLEVIKAAELMQVPTRLGETPIALDDPEFQTWAFISDDLPRQHQQIAKLYGIWGSRALVVTNHHHDYTTLLDLATPQKTSESSPTA